MFFPTDLLSAEVTIISGAAEAVIPVRVEAPQGSTSPIGSQGGILTDNSGVTLAIPINALAATTNIAITPLTLNQFNLPLVEPFSYVDSFRLNLGNQIFRQAAQLKVAVPQTIPVNSELFIYQAGTSPDANGTLVPTWFLVDTAIVGADGFAQTGTNPFSTGIYESGDYLIAYAPPNTIGKVRGRIAFANPFAITTQEFQIGAEVSLGDDTPQTIQTFATFSRLATDVEVEPTPDEKKLYFKLRFAQFTVGFLRGEYFELPLPQNIGRIELTEVPLEGLPRVTSTEVEIQPNAVNTFATSFNNIVLGPDHPSAAPQIDEISVEIAEVNGVTRSVVKLVGKRFRYQNIIGDVIFTEKHTGTQVIQTGNEVQFSVEGDKEVLRAIIPQKLAVGNSTIQVKRTQPSLREGLPPIAPPALSPTVEIAARPSYIFGALVSVDQQVVAINQTTRQQVARIPISVTNSTFVVPKDTIVTPDGTRVYVPFYDPAGFSSGVAVIDAIALQQIDVDPSTERIDVISLGTTNRPNRIAVDPQGRFAFVSDEEAGTIYQIDIDTNDTQPYSAKYNSVLANIGDIFTTAPVGLRGLAVNKAGDRLFVAAPGRTAFGNTPTRTQPNNINTRTQPNNIDYIHVFNINPNDRDNYRQLIGSILAAPPGVAGTEVMEIQATHDPNIITFTNRRLDDYGVGILKNVNGNVSDINVSHIPFNLLPPKQYPDLAPLFSPPGENLLFDSFDVNSAQAIAILPANTLKFTDADPNHPTFAFVSAFNLFAPDSPSRNPDHPRRRLGVPGGSNIAIISNPFGNPGEGPTQVVAATRPIPLGFMDNLVLSEDGQFLFAAYGGVNSVFVYNVKEIITDIGLHERLYFEGKVDPRLNLIRLPINNQTTTVNNGEIIVLEQPNYTIDINADYRLDIPFRPPNRPNDPLVFRNFASAFSPIGTGNVRGLSTQSEPVVPLELQLYSVRNPLPPQLPTPLPPSAPETPIAGDSTRRIHLYTRIDPVNRQVAIGEGYFTFAVNKKARVSLRIQGAVAQGLQLIDPVTRNTTTINSLDNVEFGPGVHYLLIQPIGQFGTPGEYNFVLTATDEDGNTVTTTGVIDHEVEINNSFPIGQTVVKGVNLWSGHLTTTSQDVVIPGRGLSLDFSRTYSSAGDSSRGPLGAGWTHNYNVRLIGDKFGNLTVVGGDGSGNTFAINSGHFDPVRARLLGLPEGARFFDPQPGYHSLLSKSVGKNTTMLRKIN